MVFVRFLHFEPALAMRDIDRIDAWREMAIGMENPPRMLSVQLLRHDDSSICARNQSESDTQLQLSTAICCLADYIPT